MSAWLAGVDAFVAAVETGSFSAAAERLNLTRSAVAKTVARMETRLGARLFHRTTRSLAVTEDGQAYYERCRRAIEEMRAGEAELDSGRREATGRLRVSAPVLFGRRCVAPILARLAARHSKLELELSFSDRLVDLVEDGFDLAIRNSPLGNGAGLIAPHRLLAADVDLRSARLISSAMAGRNHSKISPRTTTSPISAPQQPQTRGCFRTAPKAPLELWPPKPDAVRRSRSELLTRWRPASGFPGFRVG